jgi:hypothetical protein
MQDRRPSDLVALMVGLAALLRPASALASWGNEEWGTMVWGFSAPIPVPSLGDAGLTGLALLLLFFSYRLVARRRARAGR